MRYRSTLVILAAAATGTRAEEARYGLAEFESLAEKSGFQLKEQAAKVEYAEAREEMAWSKGYASGTIESLVAPMPGVTVDDPLLARTDWSKMGLFWTNKLEFVQPLYAFGAITSGRAAAAEGVKAEKQLLERERLKLRTEVHELYFGYQLAFELGEITRGAVEKLEQAVASMKGRTSSDEAQRLRAYLLEAKIQLGQAESKLTQIRAAMAWKLGTYPESLPRWDRASLKLREARVPDLDDCREIARRHRPELKALTADVAAKEALVRVEQGLRLPALFFAGRVQYGFSNSRPDQRSPFLYDPYNDFSGGVAVGLRWNLGLFESNSKVAMARAERLQAQARFDHLSRGVLVETEKNYLDWQQARGALELRSQGSEEVARRYRDSFAAYGLGTGSARALLENLGAYAVSEKNRLEAVFQHNLALARLEQAVGQAF
jgi:outer membrane protein TolC